MYPTPTMRRNFMLGVIVEILVYITRILAALLEILEQRLQVKIDQYDRKMQLARRHRRPLASLPPEIWLEIFKYAPEAIIGTGWPNMFALSVSQVCRGWRALAEGHPRLWSSISWQPDGVEAAKRFAPLWMLHLQKSGQSPLDVDLNYPSHDLEGVSNLGEVLEATLTHQHRIRRFTAWCETEHFAPEQVYLFASAPILEHVDITVNPMGDNIPPGGSIILDLSGCPALRSVTLHGNTFITNLGYLGSLAHVFLWSNSSRLVREMSNSSLLSVFRSTPSLCYIMVIVTVGNVLEPVTPKVSLPRLRKLDLHFRTGDIEAPDSLFGNLHCPSLKELHLTLANTAIGRQWHRATALHNLRRLDLRYLIGHGPLGPLEISSLLRFAPHLRSLSVHARRLSSADMILLTLQDGPDAVNICPELESITFDSDPYQYNRKEHSVELDAVVEMITSRWRPGIEEGAGVRGLRRIKLRFPEMQDIREVEPVRSYMAEGLVVEVLQSVPPATNLAPINNA